MAILIISNKGKDDTMKIIKSLKDSGLSIKGVSKTFKNESKYQNRGCLRNLLGTLATCLLVNLLRGKKLKQSKTLATRVKTAGQKIIRAGEGAIATN